MSPPDVTTADGVPLLLLTPSQAAEAIGIGRSKLYELMRSGALLSVRIGTCRRIPMSALADYVARLVDDELGDQEAG